MKQFLILLVLASGLLAQQKQPVSSLQEDCGVTFNFTAASSGAQAAGTTTAGSTGTTAVIDNRQSGCLDWLVTYEPSSAVAAISLAFQTALDIAGVPTTWSNYPGTLTSGINPNTAVTTGGAVTESTGTAYPFLRMNLTTLTGGRVQGKLYGWKRRPTNVTVIAGSACPGATPCVFVGNKSNNAVVPGVTNLGVLPALANAATPTWTEGDQVTLSVDLSGSQRIRGIKTNNAAAPGATNVGVLPCIANAAAPTWTEGFQVDCSVDLAGAQRVTGTVTINGAKSNNAVVPGATNLGVLPCLANAAAPTWTEGDQVVCSEDLAGNLRVTGAVTQTATSTALADGLSNTEPLPTASAAAVNQRAFPHEFNGSTWDREFVCPNRVLVTLTDATVTALVAVSGATVVRVCHAHATTSGAPETFSLIQGTGAACAGAPATIDSYLNALSFSTDYGAVGALRTSASNGLCVSQSGAAQSAAVFITYAQY